MVLVGALLMLNSFISKNHFIFLIFIFFSISLMNGQSSKKYFDSGQKVSEIKISTSQIDDLVKVNSLEDKKNNSLNTFSGPTNENQLSETLQTTFAGGNGYSGNYFQIDILKSGGILVTSMSGNFSKTGAAGVWVRDGTVGSSPGTGWSQVATSTISGTGKQTFSTDFTLSEGTHTIFFANTSGGNNQTTLAYSNGSGVGNVAAQNSDLKIYEGYGTSDISPNGGSGHGAGYSFSPRSWNGSITYTGATPTIVSSSLSSDNTYIDITISEAVYNANGGSGALEASDFTLTFAQNSGNATGVTISSIKKNDNTSENNASSLSGGENIIRVFLSVSGVPSGTETITIVPLNSSSIFNASGQAMESSQTTSAKTLNDKLSPTISSISIASDNSSITVTISEAVFNTDEGSGLLESSDFIFTISGGTGSLSSATPTSISKSSNVYTLGLGISGTPNGVEVITVNPVDNGLYDSSGNEAVTSQSNNSINLKDKAPPTISSISIASNNNSIYLTMSEAVYNSSGGSGALESSDFTLAISGGSATLSSSQPGEVSSSGNVYTLSPYFEGLADGNETLTVFFVDNAIYDVAGNEANATQSNSSITLKDKTPAKITSVSIASDNTLITVNISESVYNSSGGSGALESSDFTFTINGGTATLSSTSPTSISKNSNTYTLGIGISGLPNGDEILSVNPLDNGIYDLVGNESIVSQNNNSIKLNDKVLPIISTSSIDASNNFIDVTLSESVYDNNGSSPLVSSDFVLVFDQNNGNTSSVSINSVKKNDNPSLGSAGVLSGGETIIRVFLNITGTPSGVETITVSPADGSSIYDKVGNVMVSSQTTGLKNLKDKLLPSISSIFLAADNSTLSVNMSERVFNANSGSGAIETSDFVFSISGGTASLSSTTPSSIAISGNIYTLGVALSGSVDGKEELVVNPLNDSVYDGAGNEANTSQSNNIVDLYDKVVPMILSTTLASDNTTIIVAISETVYNATGGSGALETSDFSLNISGGNATLGNITPTSISSSGNSYTLGINLSGNPNGYEVLVVNPKDDSIYDSDDNEASISQSNNSVNLNDNATPALSSVSSITANGTYKIGDVLQITTIFNEEVFVTGTPQITLETGSTDAVVNYASGSGTNTLVFNYTVAAGDTTNDLDYTETTSLALNSGTIKDAAANLAVLTLSSPSATYSLGANKALVIDGNAPTVNSATSSKKNGSYGANDTIPISISFSQLITVTGTPQLKLETGTIDGLASYASGTGSKDIIFNYLIGAGENSSDLDYASTSAFDLNGGTLKDASGNVATLILSVPAATNSLGANKAIVVDTNGPSVVSVSSATENGAYNAGDTINVVVTFNDTTIVTGTPILLLETGEIDAIIDFSSGSGTKKLVFSYIVNLNHNIKKLSYKASSSLVLYGGTINDNVNNPATLTLPLPGELNSFSRNKNITIDNISPLVSSVYEGKNKDIDFINTIESLSIYWNTKLDTLSGVESYQVSLGTSPGDSNIVNWSKIDSLLYSYNSFVTMVDLKLENSITYYASVKAVDKAGNISKIMTGGGVTIDFEAPIAGSVNDGLDLDIVYTSALNSLSGNWTGFGDKVSGIVDYQYAIGTTLDGTDIRGWSSNGLDTSFTYLEYVLSNAQAYYFSVKAIDKVGNISDTVRSNGVISDLERPISGLIMDGISSDKEFTNKDTIFASWSGFADSLSGISEYEYAVGTTNAATNIVDWTGNGDSDKTELVLSISLKDASSYYISVRAIDNVGNVSPIITSNGIIADFTPPSIVNVSIEDDNFIQVLKDTTIYFTLSEAITYANAKVAAKTGDIINDSLALNINIDDDLISPIEINLLNPFTSGDELIITLTNLTDKAGNVTNDITYNYNISLLGDYDLDGIISVTDLNTFTDGWKLKDLSLQLGPTTGDAPNLKPLVDSKFDIFDAMAFTRMWHWNSNKLSKEQTRMIADQGSALNATIESDHIIFNPPKGTKAVELILDYPSSDIQFSMPINKDISDEGLALSSLDTLNGRLVYQIGYFEQNNRSIRINTKHLQKNNLAVSITYQFLGEENMILSAGSETLDLTPVPSEFALHDNYPNPFNPITTINYDLPKDAYVNLIIYDILGREVANLAGKKMLAGYQTIKWNTRNNAGNPVAAGIYFYQIQTRDFVKTKKMVLLK